MKNHFALKKGKTLFCAFLLAGTALLCACFSSGLDHYDNAIQNEKKDEEVVSDTKQNDRETESELENILEEAGDLSLENQEKTVPEEETEISNLQFRKKKYLDEHYEKHGVEMGFKNAEEYLAAANRVVSNPKALHKKEKEDNDDVYYVEETNEFVVVSGDGYIRTYFNPSAGIDYYNRQ